MGHVGCKPAHRGELRRLDQLLLQLAFLGGSDYQGTLTVTGLTADDLSFKIASQDWSTADCGAGAVDTIALDTPTVLDCSGGAGNLTLDAAATGDYQFNLDATDPANSVRTVFSQPYAVDIFLRGFNGDWNASDNTKLDLIASNTYQVELTLTDPAADGALNFKVASEDWSTVDCGSNGANAALSTAYAMDCAGGSANIDLDATEAGQYSFLVDATDPANAVLTVDQAPFPVPIFVRGFSQDWGLTNPMRFMGGTTYKVTIPLTGLEAGDRDFKIASEDWSTVDCGDSSGSGVDGRTAAGALSRIG